MISTHPLQYISRYEWDWQDDPNLGYKAPDRDVLSLIQYKRLSAGIPVLYLALVMISVAAALVATGDLLPAFKYGFPGLLFIASVVRCFVWLRRRHNQPDAETARRAMSRTYLFAVVMISATSLWAVSGFDSGRVTHSLITPLFMALGSFASASCLATMPRAAVAILLIGLAPISIRMMVSGDVELLATGISLLVVTGLQARLIREQFVEMARGLVLHQELAKVAETDLLTGLPNRRAFERALDGAMSSGGHFVLAMLDLDGFKPVNDTYGHAVGDQLLYAVGRRLASSCREGDLVARLGGDEFAVILHSLPNEFSVVDWRDRLENRISEPYSIGALDIVISVSVGTAISPRDGQTASDLIIRADSFLYRAKGVRHGKVLPISGRARRSLDDAAIAPARSA